jgi:hypothetical protein
MTFANSSSLPPKNVFQTVGQADSLPSLAFREAECGELWLAATAQVACAEPLNWCIKQ